MSNNIVTIENYFQKGTFVVPNFQRGYKWGVAKHKDAVSLLMDSLIQAKKKEPN